MNTKIAIGVMLASILAAVIVMPISTPAFAAEVAVSITEGSSSKTDDAYSPNPININVGDTVTWTNKDSQPHSATSGKDGTSDGLFGDPSASGSILFTDKTESFTFTDAGEYPYYCFLHPNMVGTVVVAGGPTPFTVSATLDSKTYEVTGKSDAGVKATKVTINPNTSVVVDFDKSGQVELTLSTSMIEGINSVKAGSQTVQFTKQDNAGSTTLAFTVPAGASSVEIMGAKVIPEFPLLVAIVLAASLVAVIGFTRFARGSGTGFFRT